MSCEYSNKEGGDEEVYFEVGTSFLLACSKIQSCDSDLIYIILFIMNTVTRRVEMEKCMPRWVQLCIYILLAA